MRRVSDGREASKLVEYIMKLADKDEDGDIGFREFMMLYYNLTFSEDHFLISSIFKVNHLKNVYKIFVHLQYRFKIGIEVHSPKQNKTL